MILNAFSYSTIHWAKLTVTAKAGALLNLYFKDSSVILQSYQLGENETLHTFIVKVSDNIYIMKDITNNGSIEVLVNSVTLYNIEIVYKLWLYNYGNEYNNITGGWTSSGYVYTGSGTVVAGVKNSDSMYCTDGSYASQMLGTNNTIDVTPYTKLYTTRKMTVRELNNPFVGILNSGKDLVGTNRIKLSGSSSGLNSKETTSVDISSITGEHYIVFANTGSMGGGYCYEVWLE